MSEQTKVTKHSEPNLIGLYVLEKIQYPLQSKFPMSSNRFLDNDQPDLNSMGYNSDEFTTQHKGKHIIFSGCSVTAGIGLQKEEVWAKKLYNKIKQQEEVSGYYNLAVTGMGTLEIIINVYKYINEFGKPDAIFLNLPDAYRFYDYDEPQDWFQYANFVKDLPNTEAIGLHGVVTMLYYQYLLMLEMYCESNNIILNYLTWDRRSKLLTRSDLKKLIKPIDQEFVAMCFDYVINNKHDKYALRARDKKHMGTAYHHAWADILYNSYVEQVGEL